ncbi:MAG: glycosyltransferase [SAR324 cluster bacterium]|nr:glycosyltransferase [SAR324 cluster bacterium]
MDHREIEISIVVPVFNESQTLPKLVEGIEKSLDRYRVEIIFIDDGSTDDSPNVLEHLQNNSTIKIDVITFRKNFGKSMALSAGLKEVEGKIVITMDADLQNDPKDLPAFIQEIHDGADLVTGWRANRDDPFEKRIPSKFYNWVTSKISGLPIHDFNCGLKAYRKEMLEELYLYGEMHRFIPVLVHKKGFTVKEISVLHHPREHGVSKYGFERYLRGALDLITVMFLTTYFVRPMHLFGGIGLSTIMTGILIFIYLFFGRWLQGISIGSSPLFTISFFAMGIGAQIVIFGFLAEMIVYWQQSLQVQTTVKKKSNSIP